MKIVAQSTREVIRDTSFNPRKVKITSEYNHVTCTLTPDELKVALAKYLQPFLLIPGNINVTTINDNELVVEQTND